MSVTDLVWPFRVRSRSPSSQSQILMVASSEQEAREVKIGWNATAFTGPRWDCNVCRAGPLRGSQVVGSWPFPPRRASEVGVMESSSD